LQNENVNMNLLLKNTNKGFTLIELLISMVLSVIVMGALIDTFITQRKTYNAQEMITEMMMNARIGMEMITREVRMGGYDPAGTGFDGITYNPTQLQIRADLNGDGDTIDTDETIIYAWDGINLLIMRNANGANEALSENITSFTFDYLDSDGIATTTTSEIRQVRVQITARTPKPDLGYKVNNGYRTYTLTSLLTPRN
jgi:prepilin-type N-terminal cleavage/methylation domain-containing protein